MINDEVIHTFVLIVRLTEKVSSLRLIEESV